MLDFQSNSVRLRDARRSCVQQDLNAILLKNFEDRFRNVGIFASKQLASPLDNGDAASKAPEELSKLQSDVAAAEDQQVFGDGVEFHDGYVVESRNIVQAMQRRTSGAESGIDENIFGGESALSAIFRANFNRPWTGKPGIAEDQVEVRRLFDFRPTAVAETVHDVALALANFSQINIDRAGEHSIVGATPREVCDSTARHHRLGRSASLIDACPSYMRPLDKSGAHARRGQRGGERRAGLPRTEDDGIVLLWFGHGQAGN